jgi:hypothetical protein
MHEPWFPQSLVWLPGIILGCTAGLLWVLVSILAARGRGKALVFGLYWILLGASLMLLGTGLFAMAAGQPYGIWYALVLAGLIGTLVLGYYRAAIFNSYRRAALRRFFTQEL